jgi:V8-like Glu-specific endopeptidase
MHNLQSSFVRPLSLVLAAFLLLACDEKKRVVVYPSDRSLVSHSEVKFKNGVLPLQIVFPRGYRGTQIPVTVEVSITITEGVRNLGVAIVDQDPAFSIKSVREPRNEKDSLRVTLEKRPDLLMSDIRNRDEESEYRYDALPFGMIFTTKNGEESRCNAVVVGPKLVLTANHCISTQEHCENSVYHAIEASSDRGTVNVREVACEQLVYTNQLYDQTLIEVTGKAHSKNDFLPIEVKNTRMHGGDELYVLTRRPAGEDRIKTLLNTCSLLKRTAFARVEGVLTYIQPALCQTEIKGGDSGSVVINSSGRLMGLLHSGLSDEEKEKTDLKTWAGIAPIHMDLRNLISTAQQAAANALKN